MEAAQPPEDWDYEALPPNTSLLSNLIAGAFAGIMEHTVMYPVDAIKIVNPTGAAASYTGIVNAVAQISSAEGVRSLWRGISSVALGAGPAHAVYFGTYEAVKHSLGADVGTEHKPFSIAAAGACATIVSDALMNPFDVIKQRMQMQGSTYRSISHCARSVYKHEGFNAFYISYPTTLAMTIPFTALQFAAYESLSKVLNPSRKYDPLTHCLSGGLAGAFAAALTTPLDVIKTMLQTRGNSTDMSIRNSSGLFEAARVIRQKEGMKGFMRGLRPRIVTTMPSTAICWTSYEMAKYYLYSRYQES